VEQRDKLARFEMTVMPHLADAYNVARWMTRNDADAEDVVQEATLRAFRFFDELRGTDSRPWLLSIVRNTCYTWLRRNRREMQLEQDDEGNLACADAAAAPEAEMLLSLDRERLRHCIELLPDEYREVLVLREFEDLSYKEIAGVTALPLGTVMSRLSRARRRLQTCVTEGRKESVLAVR
jgi:RNA polymerase sigma-70 factor (ECF subfamily)